MKTCKSQWSFVQARFVYVLSFREILTSIHGKNDELSDAQYEALQKFFEDGLAQTEMNWSLMQQEDGTVQLAFYATDLHTYSRGYVVRGVTYMDVWNVAKYFTV